MSTDKWVKDLNKLGREMDEIAGAIHPAAWSETLARLKKRWLKLAKQAGSSKKEEPSHGRDM